MSKEDLYDIIEKIRSLSFQTEILFSNGIDIMKYSNGWYDTMMLALKQSMNEAQLDLLVCYVYDPEKALEYLGSLEFDLFYDQYDQLSSHLEESKS